MLDSFTIRRGFYGLRLTLLVDCQRQEASLTASYNRRVFLYDSAVAFHEVRSPEEAERYLSRPVPAGDGTLGFTEWLERVGKADIAARDALPLEPVSPADRKPEQPAEVTSAKPAAVSLKDAREAFRFTRGPDTAADFAAAVLASWKAGGTDDATAAVLFRELADGLQAFTVFAAAVAAAHAEFPTPPHMPDPGDAGEIKHPDFALIPARGVPGDFGAGNLHGYPDDRAIAAAKYLTQHGASGALANDED